MGQLARVAVWGLAAILPASLGARMQAAAPAPRDAQAVTLVNAAIAAVEGGVAVGDLTLTGTATRNVPTNNGPSDTGKVRLEATAGGGSRIELDFGGGVITTARNDRGLPPTGGWSGPDGAVHTLPVHNLLTDGAWFYPLLGALARFQGDATVGLSYVGQTSRNNQNLDHLRIFRAVPQAANASTAELMQRVSTMDLYLDSTTHLPAFLDYNNHPDNNALRDLPVEIAYSSYASASGIAYASHITQTQGATLLLDLRLTSIAVDSGLPATDFVLGGQGGGQ